MLSSIRSWWEERKLAGLEVLIATPAFGYLESGVVGQNVWVPGAVQLLREIRCIRRAERRLRLRSLLPVWRYTQTNVAHFLRLDARMDAFSVARWRRLDLERSILVRVAARKAVLLQLADAAMPASAGDRCARARFLFWLGEVALSRAARTKRPLVRMDSWLRHVRRGAEAGSCWKSTAIVLASALAGVCVSAITSITVAPNAVGLVPLGVLLLVVLGEMALTLLQFRHARQRKRSTARSAARPGCVATFYPILLHSPWQLSAFLTLMSRNLRASACCTSVVVSVDMAGSLAKTQIGAQMMVVLQQESAASLPCGGCLPLLLRHRQQWLPDHGGWASPERKRGKVRAVVALAQGLAAPGVELVDGFIGRAGRRRPSPCSR